ncbi:protein of unknown function [Georgfuchsia toluolica]|uniref:60 kDa chaperonin n=1 Tax=Georgfuchsia toluolica TaxID=424218 RepID=A0A916MZ16_9PROT|nr:protein of unknown function [Georgfuchsia toluolica]
MPKSYIFIKVIAMKGEFIMSLRINGIAPDYTAQTTQGRINFHEWIGDSWAILFSHPRDGVSVAKEIELKDKFENIGAQMLKEAASKTSDVAGDGTTTAKVLAQAIVMEGMKHVTAGMNPMDIKRGIDKAVATVVDELGKMSKPCTTSKEIAQVGAISANADTAIGKIIADAVDKVGKEGVITIEDGKSLDNELELVEGMRSKSEGGCAVGVQNPQDRSPNGVIAAPRQFA